MTLGPLAQPRSLRAALPALFAAGVAFAAAQGFGRFGFGLVLPQMRDGLGLTTGQMGTLAGIGLAAHLLSTLPAGMLAARYGTRPVVLAGLLGTAAGLAATAVAESFVGAALAQAVVGVAGPAVIVPVLSIASRWVAPSIRGRATGAVVAGGGIGLLLGGLLVPLLLAGGEPWAWRRAWWGLSLATLVAAAISGLLVRDPPERGDIPGRGGGPARGDIHVRGAGLVAGIGAVYRSRPIWWLALVYGLYGISYIVYGTFFVAHLDRLGVDGPTAGRLWSLAGLAAIGSGVLGGWLADRLGPSVSLVAMFACQAGGLALLALGSGPAAIAVSALLYGASLWGFPSAAMKACAELVGPHRAPAAMGLLATMFAVGQAAGPIAAGLLADVSGSLTPGLLFAAGADALGAAASLLLPRARRVLA